MNPTIRPADLEADRPHLIAFLRQHLNPNFDERRFDWMYLRGPYGPAKAWIAFDSENKRFMGAAAVFPRLLFANGAPATGYVLGDFCVHPAARALGPALQLQRACLDGIAAGSGTPWYDFPSDSMAAIYRRLGKAHSARFVRWAKALRADRTLATKIGSKTLRDAIAVVANLALRTRDIIRHGKHKSEIARHQGPCGDEFTQLAQQVQRPNEICVVNTAEYLNWRFLGHPFQQFDILVARNGNALAGYVVVAKEENDARIVGLRSRNDEIADALCVAAIDEMRSLGTMTISASLVEGDRRTHILRNSGFRPREARSIAFCGPAQIEPPSGDRSRTPWHLMDGDRDG
jgi:hypothetical protein